MERRYVKQVEIVGNDRSFRRQPPRTDRPAWMREMCKSAVGETSGPALSVDAQAVSRKERADRERRLQALEVEVLTAVGERDGLVLDAERRAGQALRTMTDEEGLHCARRSSGAAAALGCER
jgi:hypothetical protein